jgi:hypothetical protein
MTAIFTNRDAAETAYDALLAHGFSKDDVTIVMTVKRVRSILNPVLPMIRL